AGLLRFSTCGSVDDGKSTLIGRLLTDSHQVYEDQLAAVTKDSATVGHAGDAVDLALLLDGLKAEREQGITIDVAYRYFSTPRRSFIIADTPGHAQYTRNMATGASTSDAAVVLVDATKGILAQTRRHSAIAALLGITELVVAVNKMDLVEYSQERFAELVRAYRPVGERLGISPTFVPVSALTGANVVTRAPELAWFDGPTLLEYLEEVPARSGERDDGPLRFPVQLVVRPDRTFRGFAGTVASGTLRAGAEVEVAGRRTWVDRIVTFDGDLDEARKGASVTVTLADEIDVARGDVLVEPTTSLLRSSRVQATLVWMADAPSERNYLMLRGHQLVSARIESVHRRLDVDSLETIPAERLELNDIAGVTLTTTQDLLFDPYVESRAMGCFVLIDRPTNATVAAGMLEGSADGWDAVPDPRLVDRSSLVEGGELVDRYGQRGCTVFLTGLSAAGKTTLARALERALFDRGCATVRLDGENMRLGISRDLGFSAQERSENVRRAAEIARLVNDQGLVAVAALVAPKASVRERARSLVGSERFVEVFVDTPIEVCRSRAAGLYAAADAGEIPQFPGVSATYDRPTDADLVLDTSESVERCVARIIDLLVDRSLLL
ncbi:MAG: adenylyl-sulfate kinase, partial [Acidimicrobiia bacterium]|nr:adenylyl-sulfate kinase [Acidimicrobiia bacterium]